jgi:hypothetical protein
VVVAAVPGFILLFTRIHRYYARTGRDLGLGRVPAPPRPGPVTVVVPVAGVSRLAQEAISHALSISGRVIAVTVVLENGGDAEGRAGQLQRLWASWDPGVPLRVLHTDYASVAEPIAAFVRELRRRDRGDVVVLIPVVQPDRLRYQLLHNHLDLVLSAALRTCPGVITARVLVPLHAGHAAGSSA